jgi:hypothetical protein
MTTVLEKVWAQVASNTKEIDTSVMRRLSRIAHIDDRDVSEEKRGKK